MRLPRIPFVIMSRRALSEKIADAFRMGHEDAIVDMELQEKPPRKRKRECQRKPRKSRP